MDDNLPSRTPADASAKKLARSLIDNARTMALGVLLPNSNMPFVSRVAVATSYEGKPMSLISDLSIHTAALRQNPNCSLLLGDVDGPNTTQKGDPLNQPRITLQAEAVFVTRDQGDHFQGLQHRYLQQIPKAKLYVDFADFNFVVFTIKTGSLNGGFGKAAELTPQDMGF